jgi:hypothetical protein
MQPGRQIRPHRPVDNINNTTINKRTRGWGLERPGDGLAALFLEGDFSQIFGRGGEDRGRNLQPGGRIRPHRPVDDINNTTIN